MEPSDANPADPTPNPADPTLDQAKPPGQPPADPAPVRPQTTLPSAAKTVLEGTKTERELALERDKARLAADLKARETRLAELEDENHRLKAVPTPSDPEPVKRGWLSGATFFDDE